MPTNETKTLIKQIQSFVGKDKENFQKVQLFLKANNFSAFSQITDNPQYLEALIQFLKSNDNASADTKSVETFPEPIIESITKNSDSVSKEDYDAICNILNFLQEQHKKLCSDNVELTEQLKIAQKSLNQTQEIIIRNGEEIKKLNLKDGPELYHKQFPQLLRLLASRNEQGWTEFVLLYGVPGAGKTTLYMQLAKALGVTPYHVALGPSAKEGKILGFNNQALGQFIAGLAYKPYKNGGLACFDEIFNCDSSVLVALNSLDNEEYRFGNGELVKRHPNFYLIANDNTNGMGSRDGFIRNKADSATLDRFTQFKLELDEDLELKISGNNTAWTRYVQHCRRFIESNSNASIYITPRTTRKGAAYLKNGISPKEISELLILNKLPATLREQLIQKIGYFKN